MAENQSPYPGDAQHGRSDSDAELWAAGAAYTDKGLQITEAQYAEAHDEMVRAATDSGEAPLAVEYERQVGEIVGRITDSAVFGKFSDGTRFRTGNLPEVTVHRGDADDYKMFPADSILRGVEHTVLTRIGTFFHDPRITRERHYMVAIPAGKSGTVVDYFFEGDYRDAFRRPVGMVHLATLMPSEDAEKLINLITEQPDAAEEYFRRAGAGLESPGEGAGIGRTESASVVMLGDWDVKNPPLDASGRKTDHFRDVFGKDAISELPYSQAFGSVPPKRQA